MGVVATKTKHLLKPGTCHPDSQGCQLRQSFDVMTYHLDDTIAAIASAAGGAARGIVRVSGPSAVDHVAKCFTPADGRPLDQVKHASAIAGQIALALDHAALDHTALRQMPCDLFLWPTERSYTRQPVAELHILGSPPLLRALLATLCNSGARLAEPGEFTLRAFLAGRIDLTQAEAVLGVIDAQHPDRLQVALGQLAGGLAAPLQQLRDELLHLLAEIEAGLDFVEEDIEFISADEVTARLQVVTAHLREISTKLSSRSFDAVAHQVVLFGPPNAGKSSLFNAMIARFARSNSLGRQTSPTAIVSSERGTTRDYLVAPIDLAGTTCELVDTAGIESSLATISSGISPPQLAAQINTAAQNLSSAARQQATLRALCIDIVSFAQVGNHTHSAACDLVIVTKADQADSPLVLPPIAMPVPVMVTSSVTGQGLDDLRDAIRKLLLTTNHADQGVAVAATADRCRDSLRAAEAAVSRASGIAETHGGNELVAAELRAAIAELGRIVGAVYTDDILDRIFSTFCIGK
jgi:tRNA modification GTPase